MAALIATFTAMGTFYSQLLRLLKTPKYRAAVVWVLITLLIGTVFYHIEEGWSWTDSLYFSVITLSTVGYGDLSPTTTASQIFTMIYIFFGMSIFVSFASMLVKERGEHMSERIVKRQSDKQDDDDDNDDADNVNNDDVVVDKQNE